MGEISVQRPSPRGAIHLGGDSGLDLCGESFPLLPWLFGS